VPASPIYPSPSVRGFPPDDDVAVTARLVALSNDLPDNSLDQFRSLVSAWQYLAVYQAFRRVAPPASLVLDWGTGNGHFAHFLARLDHSVVGYSLEPCEFRRWWPEGNFRFVQGQRTDPVHLPFPDRHFDVVCSIGVLEHVHELGGSDLDSLTEIHRVLKPGGILLCAHLPNSRSLVEALARRIPAKYRHERMYSRRAILALLENARLRPELVRPYNFLPRNCFSFLPRFLRPSLLLARIWSRADAVLGFALAPFCQNWIVVARRA
jgi:SAM-dependent methyltransferase